MITAAIMGVLGSIAGTMFGWMPELPADGVDTNVTDNVAALMVEAAKASVWVPFDAVGPAFVAIVATWVATSGVILVRRVISHVTGGGGAI